MKTKTRIVSVVLIVLLLCSSFAVLTGCQKDTENEKMYSSLDDFKAAVIGDNTASVLGEWFKESCPDVEIKYYEDNSSICAALQKGDVEAAIFDEPCAQNISSAHPDLAVFPTKVSSAAYGIMFSDGNALREPVNEQIEKFREDGTLDALYEKWITGDVSGKVIDRASYAVSDPSAETFCIAYDSAGFEPMSYLGEDKLPVGYEIELVYKIAYELNLKLEFVAMNGAALFSAVETGKADAAASSLSITEEREEQFDFSVPTYYGGVVLLCRRNSIDVQEDPDLNDPSITIAIQPSTTTGTEASAKYPNAQFIFVNNDTDGIMQVTSGKADAMRLTSTTLKRANRPEKTIFVCIATTSSVREGTLRLPSAVKPRFRTLPKR